MGLVIPAGPPKRCEGLISLIWDDRRAELAFENRALEVLLIALYPVLPVNRGKLFRHLPDHFV